MNALILAAAAVLAADPADTFLKERFGNHAVGQLHAGGLTELSAEDKRVAWHLTLASHAGVPIHYDQLGWNLLGVKRLLENVYLFGLEGKPADARFIEYLKKFYGHVGNHDAVTSQKFVPEFTPD